jgi:hypothetical protein
LQKMNTTELELPPDRSALGPLDASDCALFCARKSFPFMRLRSGAYAALFRLPEF